MKVSVRVIVHPDDDAGASPVVREVFAADRDDLALDTLGLQLAEAKDLLAAVQDTVVEQQVNTAITKQAACPDCGRARRPARRLGRPVGVPGADPAAPGVRRDGTCRRDHRPAV